jgi:ATP-binding cassette subfamily B protein
MNIKLFFSYYKPHLKIFAADMCCAAFMAAVDIAFPVMTRYIINSSLPNSHYKFFFMIIAVIFGLYVLRTAASYFVTFFGHSFGTRVESDMRRDIFSHIEQQSFRFFDNHRTGHIMSRITYDLFEITELAHHGPEDLFISIITLLGSFIVLLTIRLEMAAVIIAVLPLMIIHIIISRKQLSTSSRSVKERTAEINATLESSISGVRLTKIFTNENYEASRFRESNQEFVAAKQKYYRAMAFFQCRLDFLLGMLNVCVLALGGFLIMQHKMNLGDLIAVNLFVAAFISPIRRLTNFVELYTTGMAGFNRFAEIMAFHDETKDKPNAVEINTARGDIVYENVEFSYKDDITVLKNVNLHIRHGQKIALVGSSGSGKTTICHLLPRFYDIQGGRITLDGRDIRDITVESLRRQIGLVQQDVFMFASTIRDNIAYGRINATDEEIRNAAILAEIHDDILKMPNGYDTIIGERGITLSGGQKQRVSIARVFLKNPPILLLDEATSALDTATEIKIQKAFDTLSQGRTTLVIAHRFSTIRNADLIAVVTDEGIIARGTHDQLIQEKGLYRDLYTAQFNGNLSAE